MEREGARVGERRRRWIHARDLVVELVGRDMKLRYQRSVLGVIWSLINPIAYLLVLTFLFRRVVPLDIPNYPLFAFTGVLAWSWFTASLSGATSSITAGREFVRLPAFPLAILPAAAILSNLVHFLIALGLLVAVLLATGGSIAAPILSLPFLIVLQFTVTLGLAYFLAALNVHYRDTTHVLSVALTLGFFLTPVFYRPNSVPEAFRPIYGLNPMMHLIQSYRAVFISGEWPDGRALLALTAASAAAVFVGHRVFTRASHRFAEEL